MILSYLRTHTYPFSEALIPILRLMLSFTAAKIVPALLLGVTLTTSTPVHVADSLSVDIMFGTAPVLAAEDTSTGMTSVSDSKLRFGAASTGDKGQ